MKEIISFFLVLFLSICCTFSESLINSDFFENYKRKQIINEYLDSLSPMKRISQLFLLNIEGDKKYIPVEFYENEACVPGGVLLFSYNIANNPEQLIDYIYSINQYCLEHNLIPPYVSIDQEGGLVNRLRKINSYLPSNKKVAENLNLEQTEELYSLQALQLKSLGIHMNIAPVVECSFDSNKDFLDSRSFGDFSQNIIFSMKAIDAYEKNGIATVAKHFPGNTNIDPHSSLPELTDNNFILNKYYLFPFKMILSASPSSVLMSHARLKSFDNKPACLSEKWISGILRNAFNYSGLVISDDIFMKALIDNGFTPEESVYLALNAGVDIIMLSEKKYLSIANLILEKSKTDLEFSKKLREAQIRVINFKIKHNILFIDENNQIKTSLEDFESLNKRKDSFKKYYNEGVRFYSENFK